MSFFGSIKSFFVKAAAKANDVLKKLFGDDAAQQFAAGAGALLRTGVGAIAMQTVAALLTLKIDGRDATADEKRAEAFKLILSTSKEQGLAISGSLVNMLIELAVQAIVKKTVVIPTGE
jgi:hypothetical protein